VTIPPATEGSPAPAAQPYRWIVLVAYVAVCITAQLLWLSFSPILSLAATSYDTSAGSIGLLSAIYPLVFVLISIPSGYAVDKFGFRRALILGGALLSVSGLLRPFSPSFTALLAVQAIGAAGQPFVLNSISKLARAWFPAAETGAATGVGTASISLGVLLALVGTPPLAGALGIHGVLLLYGVVATSAWLAFLAFGREPRAIVSAERPGTSGSILEVVRNRNIVLVSALLFIVIGISNSFSTWIQPILGAHEIPAALAGLVGGGLVGGGIVGVIVISEASDRLHRFRPLLIVILVVAGLLWFTAAAFSGLTIELVLLALVGFFYLPAVTLGLEMSAIAAPTSPGEANAVVWEFAQIGGFLVIFLFEGVGSAFGWGSTFYLSGTLMFVGAGLAAALNSR
jgi:MFS transporter, FLVCR family, MFS-domain-containing protein 7